MTTQHSHPLSDSSPDPLSDRSLHLPSASSPDPLSDKSPHLPSASSPELLSDNSPHLPSDGSPHLLSEGSPHLLSDEDLLRRVGELTRRSRHTEAALVAHLGEVDNRRLYLREACSSMFAYCAERLHFSEAEASLRITAARAGREHPVLLEMLADGRLHLSGLARLAPHLTAENRDAVLQRAVHRSKREILELVAELSPQPDAPAVIRRLPERPPTEGQPRPDTVDRFESSECSPGGEAVRPQATQTRRDTIEPIAPARYKVQFTASAELRDKLERLRALMRSSVPEGDLAAVIEAAVSEKLARLEARRFARTERPAKSLAKSDTRPASRHLPAAVRRAVTDRDGLRCAYRDDQGHRCSARERLEFHHRRPYGVGGDHSVQNLALLCRAHNGAIAETDYGSRVPRGPSGSHGS